MAADTSESSHPDPQVSDRKTRSRASLMKAQGLPLFQQDYPHNPSQTVLSSENQVSECHQPVGVILIQNTFENLSIDNVINEQ